ncbi:hypothetical protein [Streptomyces sp. NPDC093514]|uniref:hypothetical protein n=1 Tax=Streptomyces sp. NPDC093514 TaxID=3366039 RepID=UPI0038171CC5
MFAAGDGEVHEDQGAVADAHEVVGAGGADPDQVVDEQRRGLAAAAGLPGGLHLLDELLEPVAGEAGDASSSRTPCSARAETMVPDRRRSMVEGAVHVPFFQPGWVQSHSTNITSVPGVTASTGTSQAVQNFVQLAQSWA